jgi:hypothetical protein
VKRIAMAALAVACAAAARAEPASVALVIDASGSMTAKLVTGETRIDAAKQAIAELAGKLPDDINVSLRAYGHQSHRSKKDCKDTALLTPFGSARDRRGEIVARSGALTAQGYTPITHVLGLAADDLKSQPGRRTIVLVSDGKETCEGDPCVLARKLAEADAALTIHTVGFGVDDQTRRQLQCIARAGRGDYRDANGAGDLLDGMIKAAESAPPKKLAAAELTVAVNKPGALAIENGQFHNVLDAATGRVVGSIGNGIFRIELPAGVYHAQFGDRLLWKSIEVEAGKTTTIRAAVLKIDNHQFHDVLDAETGQEVADYANTQDYIALPPGRYDVTFGDARWGEFELKEGETRTLIPGGVAFDPATFQTILKEDGTRAAIAATGASRVMLPPGRYKVKLKAGDLPIEIREGEILTVRLK